MASKHTEALRTSALDEFDKQAPLFVARLAMTGYVKMMQTWHQDQWQEQLIMIESAGWRLDSWQIGADGSPYCVFRRAPENRPDVELR
ncbi:hypothetical protein [Granulicoccus phenolivorans]|uniref:hypothetical protein n=1 Tax=Granulicoccus phenolivorans TaxID=266854 RepID=UPI00041C52E8|nr:hypothetical protein [Granulicoccus phenolivorans]